MDWMNCNDTCCSYQNSKGGIECLCFIDNNYTDFQSRNIPPSYEIALRWSTVVPLFLLGFIGNLVVIIILIKNKIMMNTSVNIFILNMAISDFTLATTGPLTFTIRETNEFWVLGEFWCHADGFIQVAVMIVSVLSLSTISVDRMLGILHPMHQHLNKRQSSLIILFIWILSIAMAVPFYIYRLYGVRRWQDLTEVFCSEETNETNIYWLVTIIILNWLPLLVMIFSYTNLFVGFKNHAMKVEGKEHPGILKMKKRFVKMLFAMIIVFIICWGPFQAFIFFREKIIISDKSNVSETMLYDIVLTVIQYMMYFNCAINPFIYGLMHTNFKRAFRITFPCIFKNKPIYSLMASHGRHAFVWSRNSVRRHSLTVPPSEMVKPADRIAQSGELKRCFSHGRL